MDKQELFNRVYLGLAKQGFKQSGETYSSEHEQEPRFACRYRGDEGMKCAVGFLLTDEAYSEVLEGHAVSNDVVQEAVCTSLGIEELNCTLYTLLQKLQQIHDYSASPEVMREDLHAYARRNNLSIPSEEGEVK